MTNVVETRKIKCKYCTYYFGDCGNHKLDENNHIDYEHPNEDICPSYRMNTVYEEDINYEM